MTPRLAAVVLIAGLAAAASLPRRRPTACTAIRPALPEEARRHRERFLLLFGDMPSRTVH